ncbi:Veg family protein [Dethiothermospora halolimnae]|uniref:Veg family protein n=1 Tax=Dethiothermospora halolimnae TaxID=3114390 RepID=UPI003CCB9886
MLRLDIELWLWYNLLCYLGKEGDGLLQKNSLFKIKEDVENCIGKKVRLKANKGRKKTTVREGILEDAYPSIFVVKIDGGYNSVRRVSYSYSDILTETVEVTICGEDRKINIS